MRSVVRVTILSTVAIASSWAAVGCGSGAPELVEGVEVEILAVDNAFDPETPTVEAGTVVRFTNVGRNDHNVIPENDDPDWTIPAERFGPGDTATYRFTEPGTFRYYCSIHGTIDVGMPGSITVVAP